MQIKPERFVKAALLLTFPSFCIAVVEKYRTIQYSSYRVFHSAVLELSQLFAYVNSRSYFSSCKGVDKQHDVHPSTSVALVSLEQMRLLGIF